jgi:hypothetical protein
MKTLRYLFAFGTLCIPVTLQAETSRPNVHFITLDDLNDWIGCMRGNPQSITPNCDRLSASGQFFTNTDCVASSCNPSRTAINRNARTLVSPMNFQEGTP